MRFKARGNVHLQGAAATVVHGAVVNVVAVDGRADADMVDVRGEDDEFILESWIGTGEFANNVRGFEGFGENDGVGFERGGQGEVRKRLAVFAQGRDFGEGVAGTGEQFFRGGGGESHAQLGAGGFV